MKLINAEDCRWREIMCHHIFTLFAKLFFFIKHNFHCCLRRVSNSVFNRLYTFCISCEFRVLLMLQKNKPQNLWLFTRMPTLAQNGVKCKSEKRGVKCEKSDVEYPAIHFSFFAFSDRFCVFCDKRIASVRRIHTIVGKSIDIVNLLVMQPVLCRHVSCNFFCWSTCQADQHFVDFIKECRSTDCSLKVCLST